VVVDVLAAVVVCSRLGLKGHDQTDLDEGSDRPLADSSCIERCFIQPAATPVMCRDVVARLPAPVLWKVQWLPSML
jgi:hypothetical protein